LSNNDYKSKAPFPASSVLHGL